MANQPSALSTAAASLRARWASLSVREQRGLRWLGALLAVTLTWTVLLAPALRTIGQAQAQYRVLDADIDTMLRLQQRAVALQSQSAVSDSQVLKAVQTAATVLGSGAKVQVLGDQVTVTLQHTSTPELAQWLAQPAGAIPLQPTELHLQRDAGDKPAWSGSARFVMPQTGGAKP